jgi:hypothetical protein
MSRNICELCENRLASTWTKSGLYVCGSCKRKERGHLATIPCLSPDEMRCTECGHYGGPDEVDWLHFDKTGIVLCINCVE